MVWGGYYSIVLLQSLNICRRRCKLVVSFCIDGVLPGAVGACQMREQWRTT